MSSDRDTPSPGVQRPASAVPHRDAPPGLATGLIRGSGTGSVVLADIDDFKRINDGFGHDDGDHVLVHAGGLLRGICRAQDTVARRGGEEFLFLLPSTAARQPWHLPNGCDDACAPARSSMAMNCFCSHSRWASPRSAKGHHRHRRSAAPTVPSTAARPAAVIASPLLIRRRRMTRPGARCRHRCCLHLADAALLDLDAAPVSSPA